MRLLLNTGITVCFRVLPSVQFSVLAATVYCVLETRGGLRVIGLISQIVGPTGWSLRNWRDFAGQCSVLEEPRRNFLQRRKNSRLVKLNLYTPHSSHGFIALDSRLLVKALMSEISLTGLSSRIQYDEGLTLEMSAFESLYNSHYQRG